MKCLARCAGVAFALGAAGGTAAQAEELPQEWLNIQGVGWDAPLEDPGNQLRLALGVGYRYVYHEAKHDGYEGPYRRDLFFYLNDPHKQVHPSVEGVFTDAELAAARGAAPYTLDRHPMLPRAIDEREFKALRRAAPRVFEAYKTEFEATKSWANTDQPFPHNLAQLQTWGAGVINRWEPCPDVQQDAVIDEHIAAIVAHVRAQERPDDGYLFKGVVFDVPEIWKEFNWNSNRGLPGTPDENRTAVARPGVGYDHATLQEGWYHFLYRLQVELEKAFPDRGVKRIYEPAAIWADWGQYVADIPYASITPEMTEVIRGHAMFSEKPTLEFLTQKELADNGWPPNLLGNATADLFPKNPSFPTQLVVLGECAARGSNFFAYGTFARQFDRDTHTYGPDLLLIRIVAGWENMHATPVEARLWDYDQRVYLSPTAVADEQALATVNPYTGEILGTLRSPDATIKLADGLRPADSADAIRGVNAFFEPVGGESPVVFEDGVLQPKPGVTLPLGFRLRLAEASADGGFFSHPQRETLVHRPQDEPYIMRELYNPDFELGPDGWYTGDGGRVRVVPEAEVVRGGTLSGKLIARTRPWHGFTQRVPDLLNINGPGRYRITGHFQQPAEWDAPVRAYIHLMVATAEGREAMNSQRVLLRPGEWVEVTAEFDAAFDGVVSAATLSFRINHEKMPFYLDDVSIEKLD
ncbi:MAG: carbohydrate binding domain-containing protein [Planctomycetota bacterium]